MRMRLFCGQTIAVHVCAQLLQPQSQPRTFKAGVAGDEYRARLINIVEQGGLFPGFPGRGMGVPHLVQMNFVAQRIHALPETGMPVRH